MSDGPRSSTATLVKALGVLARDIVSEDGVAEACLLEASDRLTELRSLLIECWPHVVSHSVPSPTLLQRLVRELPEVRQ